MGQPLDIAGATGLAFDGQRLRGELYSGSTSYTLTCDSSWHTLQLSGFTSSIGPRYVVLGVYMTSGVTAGVLYLRPAGSTPAQSRVFTIPASSEGSCLAFCGLDAQYQLEYYADAATCSLSARYWIA